MTNVNDLLRFLADSPCNFYAVANAAKKLEEAGFSRLDTRDHWSLAPGDKHYIIKNDSALFAFVVGKKPEAGWKIISSHSDSPGFRIKPNCEMPVEGKLLKLNTEVYGGPILYTWFDRPLSIAGRVFVRGEETLMPKRIFVKWDEPLLTIPHLAIHYNRQVNDGNPLSRQKDMLPVAAKINDRLEADGFLLNAIAKKAGVQPSDILDYDLSLYDTTRPCLTGFSGEFISAGRIDDLMMVHASICAMLQTCEEPDECTRLIAIFDNEETGSGTKQGAASP